MALAFDGGAPTKKEIADFVEYLLMFYAEGELYDAGMTEEDAIECTYRYLQGDFECIEENWVRDEFGFKVPTHLWGGGDTLDREKVFEIYETMREVA